MRLGTAVGALVVGCGVLAAACSGADTLEPGQVAGDYVLVSVGGQSLPATVIPPGGPRTYLGGYLTLGADRHFVQVASIQSCPNGTCSVGTLTIQGTWSVLQDGSLYFDGDHGHAEPPPLVLADGRRVTFCASSSAQPCTPEQQYERQ